MQYKFCCFIYNIKSFPQAEFARENMKMFTFFSIFQANEVLYFIQHVIMKVTDGLKPEGLFTLE